MSNTKLIKALNTNETPTFGDIAKPYIGKQQQKKQSWRKRMMAALKRISETILYDLKIKEIPAVKAFRTIERIPKLSNGSKNYLLTLIRQVFIYAEEEGLIGQISLEKIKTFPTKPRKPILPDDKMYKALVDKLTYPEIKRKKKATLPDGYEHMPTAQLCIELGVSESTIKRMKKEAEGFIPSRKGVPEVVITFEFLCLTGMRLGEAINVSWGDVSGDAIRIKGTKTESADRTLLIHPSLKELLNKISTYRKTRLPEEKVLRRKNILKPLRRACKSLGIPPLRHHDLRHYFATRAVDAGIPPPVVAQLLGHNDSGQLIFKTYYQTSTKAQENYISKLNFPQSA
jgi:integrase